MSKKGKKKPYDPAAAARHRQERAESAAEIARLRAQPSTAVNVDKRTGRLTGAWRLNCFNTLLPAGGHERMAIDWLEETIRTAAGENGAERRPDYIRGTASGALGQNVTNWMIAAGLDLHIIEQQFRPDDIRMLMALMQPDADLMTRWRAVVEKYTLETDPRAQAARVRAACAHLVWVKDRMPMLRRQYHERRAEAA
ncbi:hypothetical protein [Brevundimonas diminuta]|uniref:hypothetical protein n=1 Tax=Brevundimonas diminuta TaxID=293 RepID=UPI0030F56261